MKLCIIARDVTSIGRIYDIGSMLKWLQTIIETLLFFCFPKVFIIFNNDIIFLYKLWDNRIDLLYIFLFR